MIMGQIYIVRLKNIKGYRLGHSIKWWILWRGITWSVFGR